MMAVFSDPFDALSNFQQALDAFRASSWLEAGPSGGGAYPPMNVFRKGDDFVIITEIPGVRKSDLDIQVKGRTLRLSGVKKVEYPQNAAVHRREPLAGRFDRAVTLPVEIDPDDEGRGQHKVDHGGREQGDGGPREKGAGRQGGEDGPWPLLHPLCRHL
jgi:HSP20 family protein